MLSCVFCSRRLSDQNLMPHISMCILSQITVKMRAFQFWLNGLRSATATKAWKRDCVRSKSVFHPWSYDLKSWRLFNFFELILHSVPIDVFYFFPLSGPINSLPLNKKDFYPTGLELTLLGLPCESFDFFMMHSSCEYACNWWSLESIKLEWEKVFSGRNLHYSSSTFISLPADVEESSLTFASLILQEKIDPSTHNYWLCGYFLTDLLVSHFWLEVLFLRLMINHIALLSFFPALM